MESRNHFKNGASLKSHTIRGNYIKYLLIVFVCLFIVNIYGQTTWQISNPITPNVTTTLNNETLTISATGAMQNWPDYHGSSATSVMLDGTRTISLTNQNDYSLESRHFLWKCGTEPLTGNISSENFAFLMSYLDLAYEALQELTGFTPENGRQVNIELLAEDDWAGGRGGGGYIGINRDWIGNYMREVERDGGAPNGLFLHELGHNFDWGTGQRWFNGEMGATTLAYFVREKLNLVFYHDYAGEALLGSDWIDFEYTEIINRYNRGETTKNDYEWDFFVCLWKLFHETNWESLKAVYHSYSDRFVMWDFMDRLSSFSEIPVDTYFYPDLNQWIHEVYTKDEKLYEWEIGSPNVSDVIAKFENGTLTINGTGEMQDFIYNHNYLPWYSVKDEITSVIINESVTTIGNSAFLDCISLTSIIIPKSVTKIGEHSLQGCNSLNEIHISNPIPPSVGDWCFYDVNTDACKLYVPAGSINVYKSAAGWKDFYNILTEELTWNIGYPNPADIIATFNNGTLTITGTGKMQDFIYNHTTLPWYSVKDEITSVTINEGVTTIGNSAFLDCISLASVKIPNGITKIGEHSFQNSCNLISVNIPNSVINIGEWAFGYNDCSSSLTDITVNWTTPLSIDNSVFYGVNLSNIALKVPAGTQCTYAAAPVWKDFNIIGASFSITPSAGSGGSISPSNVQMLACGSNITFTATPNSGKQIDQWVLNGSVVQTGGTTYTISNVQADATLQVTFKDIPTVYFTITATAGSGGSISPSGEVIVNQGANQTFTFTPNINYEIDEVKIDSVANSTAKTNGFYTFSNVISNHTLSVTFIQNQQSVVPEETQPIGEDGKGTIGLSLSIPSGATLIGSFEIRFPEGMTLDEQLTVLSLELSVNFYLSFSYKGNNTWLIEIKSNVSRSYTVSEYKKIMDIAYKVNDGVQKGTYKAEIMNLDFLLDNNTPIKEDLLTVTINVEQDVKITSIPDIHNKSFSVYFINNTFRIESSEKELITIYSVTGVPLYSTMKDAGLIEIPVASIPGSVFIIKGSISGAIKIAK